MRRVWLLAGLTAIALSSVAGSGVNAARAASLAPRPGATTGGEVTALSVVPTTGKAEVVIAIGGAVQIADFALSSPARVVLDISGAKLTIPARLYDRVRRGSITNVRVAQYTDDVVRIVVDMDKEHAYTVTRGDGNVRIAVDGAAGTFTAWHNTPELSTSDNDEIAHAVRRAQESRNEAPVFRKSGTKRPSSVVAEPRITVTYQDADIKEVIAAFAVFSGRTIVVGKGVAGTISAEVRDQPWDVALRAILTSQGLAAVEDADGIITVDSYENIASKQATEPLQTRILAINYAHALTLVPTVKGLLSVDCGTRAGGGSPGANATCAQRGSVNADTATNRLIITDVPSRLEDIANYIRDLDLRTPQVAIKAKIIFVNRTNIEDLGLAYDLGTKNTFFNKLVQRTDPATLVPVDLNGDGVPDALGGGTQFPSTQNNVQLGGNSLAAIANANQRVVEPALSLIFSTVLGKFTLTSFLDALQEVSLADIQAEPSIVTLDNREATILSGEETPIRIIDLSAQSGGVGQVPRATVSFKQTGIKLVVRPHVTNNRMVQMTLHAERSNLQAAASDLGYTFQTQQADNQLLVGDGETAVIGGLTVTQVTQSKSGIPILVDLPLVGRLFGETRTQEDKRDLLILVTPHIVDEGEKLGSPEGEK